MRENNCQTLQNLLQNTLILSLVGASKFAPHLEKCLGMGRTSSRLAHKKTPVSVESEEEHSEDNEEDWTYPEKKCKFLSTRLLLQ